MKRVSLVIPVYNEAANLPTLRQRIGQVVADLTEYRFEILLVDDYSSDATRALAGKWACEDSRVRYVRLSRNFGSHAALSAGLHMAGGDCAVLLAADLQDPPELIPQLLSRWVEGYRVVWAVRRNVEGIGPVERISSELFWWLMRRSAAEATPPAAADFLLVDRAVIDAYTRVTTRNESIIATICWLGFAQTCVPYNKAAREGGRSGWTFAKRWKLCVDSIVGFSYWPIRAISGLGFAVAVSGFAFLAFVLWHRLTGRTSVPGWAGMMAVMLAGMGVLMTMVGVLGEYLWRVLDEIRGRPKYVIEETIGAHPTETGIRQAPVEMGNHAGIFSLGVSTAMRETPKPAEAGRAASEQFPY
jgi:glycosyltransferase involved in cell wall biosynthesis